MLYLHGEGVANREQLHEITVPNREGIVSNRWVGISHGVLADTIVEAAGERGLFIAKEQWQTAGTQSADLFGSLDFKKERGRRDRMIVSPLADLELPEGMGLSLGVRHSNLGKYAITFAVGGRVFVCSNGMMVGQFTLKRKHTTGLNLRKEIDLALDRYVEEAPALVSAVAEFRNSTVSNDEAARILVEAGRQRVLAWSHLPDVDTQWQTPEFPDFEDRTEWSLLNAFTYVAARNLSATGQFRLQKELPQLFRACRELRN